LFPVSEAEWNAVYAAPCGQLRECMDVSKCMFSEV